MKTSLYIFLILALCGFTTAAQEIAHDLHSFDRIVASPKINLILQKGEKESIRLVYENIDEDKINIEVNRNTLRIYLDDARVVEKTRKLGGGYRKSIYEDVSVTAYVTYVDLKHLEIRGHQELTCLDPIKTKQFTLKAYGENDITLASVKTGYLKMSLYGENSLKIKGGMAEYQKYRLFGENKIDSRQLKSYAATTNIYGESKIKISIMDELKINSFGESEVRYDGDAEITRGLVFGRTHISRMN